MQSTYPRHVYALLYGAIHKMVSNLWQMQDSASVMPYFCGGTLQKLWIRLSLGQIMALRR